MLSFCPFTMTHTQIHQMDEMALKTEFDREGFVILRDIIPSDYVENAKPAINTLVDREADRLVSEGKLAERFTGDPFESRLIRLFERYPDEAPKSYRPELHLAPFVSLFFQPRYSRSGASHSGRRNPPLPQLHASPESSG